MTDDAKNLKKHYKETLQREKIARESAEKAIDANTRLAIKLDIQTKYAEEIAKTLIELQKRPPEKVEVPVVIELVPDEIRKRMSELSRRNRVLEERVEQLEMILSSDGKELLLPE